VFPAGVKPVRPRGDDTRDHLSSKLRKQIKVHEWKPYYEDRVLVRRIDPPRVNALVELPYQSAREKLGIQFGEVVAVGPGNTLLTYFCDHGNRPAVLGNTAYTDRKPGAPKPDCKCGRPMEPLVYTDSGKHASTRQPLSVKPGDRVLYARVPPQEFEQDGETYTFCFEEQHILAVLEG